MNLEDATVLVVEDGDEYFENLAHFVPGPRYLQAHDAQAALALCETDPPDVIWLDLRFDRTPADKLAGTDDPSLRNLPPAHARRLLQDNQGLFILEHLKAKGFARVPVVLASDLDRDPERAQRLQRRYPQLRWLSDGAGPGAVREALQGALATPQWMSISN